MRTLARLRHSTLARNTGWMALAFGSRLFLQAAYFVLVVRALGPSRFGAFAAALALVSILSPFAALGTGNLLVMRVARRPESFRVQWGTALVAIPLAGIPLALVVIAAWAVLLRGLPLQLVLALVVAELLFSRLSDTAAQAFQAFERMAMTAAVRTLPSVARLGAAVVFVSAGWSRSAETWALAYLGGTVVAATVAYTVVTIALDAPRLQRVHILPSLREGVYFALAQSSSNIYTDIDKTMLARLSTLSAAGIYAAAYRAAALAFVPVTSMLSVTYARFFKRGEDGVRGSAAFARELFPFAVGYALVASLALAALAPLAPVVLGSAYADSTSALRWLAVLPVLQAVYYLAGDAVTGAGYQRLRTLLEAGAAALNVLLNLVLIPAYSWRGAAYATIVSLAALGAALWVAVAILARRPVLPAQPSMDVP